MAKDETIEVDGKVIDLLPRGEFRVQLENKHTVIAHVSGKIRVNNIRISPGDTVTIAISPYDLTRGRIIYRK
jgi:translation initiation factor IF-1